MADPGAPTPPPTPPAQAGPTTGATAGAAVKADTMKRFVAVLIDGVIAAVLTYIPYIGGLLGALYILLRDGFEFEFMDLRSVGKRVMKLRPVRLDGQPMTLGWSARRNWPLVFASLWRLLLFIPILGWLFIPLVLVAGAVLSILEAVLVLTDPEGRRWGDRLANTKVIEVEA